MASCSDNFVDNIGQQREKTNLYIFLFKYGFPISWKKQIALNLKPILKIGKSQSHSKLNEDYNNWKNVLKRQRRVFILLKCYRCIQNCVWFADFCQSRLDKNVFL